MTSTGTPTVPPQLRGYEAHRRLGVGTSVTYWLGRRSGDGVAAGLSFLDAPLVRLSGLSQRLAAVVRQVAPLRHPRIVGTVETATGDGTLAVVTEAVDGIPLTAILRPGEPLPAATAMEIVDDLLRAVGAAHAAGIVHCGIVPGRVLVTANGEVRLDGFAVARTLALTGGEIGAAAPGFNSPERLGGSLPDGLGDLYSAAAVAHLLLVGTTPAPGVAAPVPALPGIQEILRRAISANPAQRYPSASALRGALAATTAETLDEDWRSRSDLDRRAAAAIAARDADAADGRGSAVGLPAAAPAMTMVGPPVDAVPPASAAHEASTTEATPPAAVPPLPRPVPPHAAPPPAGPRRSARPPGRGRRLRTLLITLLGIAGLAGAAVGGWIWAGKPNPFSSSSTPAAPPGPLAVGTPITLDVARTAATGAVCDVTFRFTAKGPLSGQGELVYHFEQSDGRATPDTTIHITNEGSFSLDHDWRFQGSTTGTATLTFVVTAPTAKQANGSPGQPTKVPKQIDITCPPGH